jgi:hypothetical protein
MPPRSALNMARRYLRDAIAAGYVSEALARDYARAAMLDQGQDEDSTNAAVTQVWREDYAIMGPN